MKKFSLRDLIFLSDSNERVATVFWAFGLAYRYWIVGLKY